jgi:galactokinase/mevalonate kinase-like predicted kinase
MGNRIIRSIAPLRLGIAGGSSDLPSFVERFGGYVLNATINKYVYASLYPRKDERFSIKSEDYGIMVNGDSYERLSYDGNLDLIKAVINRIRAMHTGFLPGFDITVASDAPPGAGLGTSSTVIVAILGLFREWLSLDLNSYELAKLAWDIERKDMLQDGGYQDQYAACVPLGTRILVNSQHGKPIESINVGDSVLTYNEKTGKKELKKVLKTFKRQAREHLLLKFDNHNRLQVTPEHPLYVINKGWVMAKDLNIGDEVIQKKCSSVAFRTYNIRINDTVRSSMSALGWNAQRKTTQSELLKEKHKDIKSQYRTSQKLTSSSRSSRSKSLWRDCSSVFNSPEYRQKQSLAGKKRYIENPNSALKGIRKAQEVLRNKLKDKEYRERWVKTMATRLANAVPSSLEKIVINIIDEICPNEFAYNGDARVGVIGRKIPDFININGKKKLIEVNGNYWHNKKDHKKRVSEFKQLGWETLTIWEDELKNIEKVKSKIKTYVFNPDVEIIKITEIIPKHTKETVYNIEVEDNNNYFAYGVLVHNCFGGFNFMEFHKDGSVIINPLAIRSWIKCELQHNLLLVYSGMTHRSPELIKEQAVNSEENTKYIQHIKEIAVAAKEDLLTEDLRNFGQILSLEWGYKKKLSNKVSNEVVEAMEEAALEHGAEGLKLTGAGGGGMMIVYADWSKKRNIANALKKLGCQPWDFNWEDNGVYTWSVRG